MRIHAAGTQVEYSQIHLQVCILDIGVVSRFAGIKSFREFPRNIRRCSRKGDNGAGNSRAYSADGISVPRHSRM